MSSGETRILFLIVLGVVLGLWAATRVKGAEMAREGAAAIFGNLAVRVVLGLLILAVIALVKLIGYAL